MTVRWIVGLGAACFVGAFVAAFTLAFVGTFIGAALTH